MRDRVYNRSVSPGLGCPWQKCLHIVCSPKAFEVAEVRDGQGKQGRIESKQGKGRIISEGSSRKQDSGAQQFTFFVSRAVGFPEDPLKSVVYLSPVLMCLWCLQPEGANPGVLTHPLFFSIGFSNRKSKQDNTPTPPPFFPPY